MRPLTGGCLCGSVRYVASAEPTGVRACWCRVCQYLACGNATVNLVFNRQDIDLTGELRDLPGVADSGSHMHRGFCPRCGVHVTSEAAERPRMVVIRAGTLDDAGRFAPQSLIWTGSAPDWAYLDPDLPCFERQPPPPAARS